MSDNFAYHLNGVRHVLPVTSLPADRSLLMHLRDIHGLTGAKGVCLEGGCGACTVMVVRPGRAPTTAAKVTEKFVPKPHCISVAACMTPMSTLRDCHITTVEAIAPAGSTSASQLHPLQEAMLLTHASQCGYCTPGFVMALYAQLYKEPNSTREQLERAIDGNLCRCTGYRPILDAIRVLASDVSADELASDALRQVRQRWMDMVVSGEASSTMLTDISKASDTTITETSLASDPEAGSWRAPISDLDELLHIRQQYPGPESGILACGCSDIVYDQGIHPPSASKTMSPPVFMSVASTHALNVWQIETDKLIIGAALPLEAIEINIKELLDNSKQEKNNQSRSDDDARLRGVRALHTQLRFFGNAHIRAVASVGGSLVSCAHLGDLLPVLMVLDATLVVHSAKHGERCIPISDWVDPETGRPTLKPAEVLVAIHLPWTTCDDYVEVRKQGRRRVDTTSLTVTAFRVTFEPQEDASAHRPIRVKRLISCLGGLGKPGQRAHGIETLCVGKEWRQKTLLIEVIDLLRIELATMQSDHLPAWLLQYQRALVLGSFFKFFLSVQDATAPVGEKLDERDRSSFIRYSPHPHNSEQCYVETGRSDGAVGKSFEHRNAMTQLTGDARYTADLSLPANGLYASLVCADRAHARILGVDASAALALPDIAGVFTAADIPGAKMFGFRVIDEYFLAEDEVFYDGQPIAVVVASTQELADKAARDFVRVDYEDLKPIITIEDAIAANSYHADYEERVLQQGDPDRAMENCRYVEEGLVVLGGQDHWYLEPQNALVHPSPQGVVVHSSTQSPSDVQEWVATFLDLPRSNVECRVERVGGGFGGKQLRASPIACLAALPAFKLQRPVKLMLSRPQDMRIHGGLSPYQARFRVGFDDEGCIMALDIEIWSNGGHSLDYSGDILETVILVVDSAYRLPNVRIKGHCCKTHLPSFTALRGFGKPQASAIIESVIDHIARTLSMDSASVRTKNMYAIGDMVITGTPMADDALHKCWTQVLANSNYDKLKKECEEFNTRNRWKKRGVAAMPSKGNVGFLFSDEINRGVAQVCVYKDATCYVSHSGVEMGQGIATRMAQVAAEVLDVPITSISVGSTSTKAAINTPPTTMVSTDLCGAAVRDALQIVLERMAPVREALGGDSVPLADVARRCYLEGIDMQASAIVNEIRLEYDWQKQAGNISYFFVWGAAVSMVELDVLTGSVRTLKTEIVQDCGSSLNPPLDVGQVEGAFLMGLGYYMLEELIWSPEGRMYTTNLSTYKLPSHDDTPESWRVHLLKDSPSVKGLYHSKGIGESNLQLGMSVYLAAKDAIASARADEGLDGPFHLEIPATDDRIRAACPDRFHSGN
ncbi:MAG: xanthine dehydrogenase/oxidase [Planctomycetota bacterium]|jgi:xanthine dehydrogenase/oxidase